MADDGVNEQRPWIGGTGRTELAPYVDQVDSAPRVDPAARPCRVACPGWRDVLDVSAAVADAGRMDEGVRSTAAETASLLRAWSRRSTPAAEPTRCTGRIWRTRWTRWRQCLSVPSLQIYVNGKAMIRT
jgi:hypothetical protein